MLSPYGLKTAFYHAKSKRQGWKTGYYNGLERINQRLKKRYNNKDRVLITIKL